MAKNNNVVLLPYQNRKFDSDFLTVKQIFDNEGLYEEMIEIESNHTYFRRVSASQDTSIFNGMVYGFMESNDKIPITELEALTTLSILEGIVNIWEVSNVLLLKALQHEFAYSVHAAYFSYCMFHPQQDT